MSIQANWNLKTLHEGGLSFLVNQEKHCGILANTIGNYLQSLAFLVPFNGNHIKNDIKALREKIFNCHKSVETLKDCRIGYPEDYAKLDTIARKAFKQLKFLDYLNETVTLMERKNVCVLAATGTGILAVCLFFARFAMNSTTFDTPTLKEITATAFATSFLLSIASPIYADLCLSRSYQNRLTLINHQYNELRN